VFAIFILDKLYDFCHPIYFIGKINVTQFHYCEENLCNIDI